MQITLESLKLITNEYPLATPANIQKQFILECKKLGLSPDFHKMLGDTNIKLSGYVAYITIHSDADLHCKYPIKTFTFNQNIVDLWHRGIHPKNRIGGEIYNHKMLMTSGKSSLTTLCESDYNKALHEIEKQLMLKYGIDSDQWMKDIRNADQVYGAMSTCPVFEGYQKMIQGLFIKEGLFISEYD
jgi:hypothetical protein